MMDYVNKLYSLNNISRVTDYYSEALHDDLLCIIPKPQDMSRFAYPIRWIANIEYDKNIFEEDTIV